MNDYELEQIIRKRMKITQLRRARQRVRQLEQERGGPLSDSEDLPYVPMFLRARRDPGMPAAAPLAIPLVRDEHRALAGWPADHLEPAPARVGRLAVRDARLAAPSQARSRLRIDLLPEPAA